MDNALFKTYDWARKYGDPIISAAAWAVTTHPTLTNLNIRSEGSVAGVRASSYDVEIKAMYKGIDVAVRLNAELTLKDANNPRMRNMVGQEDYGRNMIVVSDNRAALQALTKGTLGKSSYNALKAVCAFKCGKAAP